MESQIQQDTPEKDTKPADEQNAVNETSTASEESTEDVQNPEHAELEQRIIAGLKTVFDPEIPVNIYDLGLIYNIKIYPDQTVFVLMTLTAPGCPVAGSLPQEAENAVRDVEGVVDARVELTFEPPYTMDMMSEEAKFDLGFL